jgi:hypothetical protein
VLPPEYPPASHFGGGALFGVLAIKVHVCAAETNPAEKKKMKEERNSAKTIERNFDVFRIILQ